MVHNKSGDAPRKRVEEDASVDESHAYLPLRMRFFESPLCIRIGSHIRIIHTVEQAIVWIDNQAENELRRALAGALKKLYAARQANSYSITGAARDALASAFRSQNLLIS